MIHSTAAAAATTTSSLTSTRLILFFLAVGCLVENLPTVSARLPFLKQNHNNNKKHNLKHKVHSSIFGIRGGADRIDTSSSATTANVETKSENSSSELDLEKVFDSVTTKDNMEDQMDLWAVFSDVDGTLVHYPESIPKDLPDILKLPPSSTGMRGIISSQTLESVQTLRNKKKKDGIKFVLVSGMRTSTLLSRLPYLPKADAYCSEGGGRIFYPVNNLNNDNNDDGDGDVADTEGMFIVKPEKYKGASASDLEPFGLVEDMEWRARVEEYAGAFGSATLKELAADPVKALPKLEERDGLLWDFARSLTAKGYVLDTKGYSACFRVNQKQQQKESKEGTAGTSNDFQALLDGKTPLYEGLSTSVNLSCIDYYPSMTGKKNCCQYLAEKFCSSREGFDAKKVLSDHAVCICDDDNDLEMAMAVNHAYIPEVSSSSMAEIIDANPKQFTSTFGENRRGTKASEIALLVILTRISNQSDE